MTKYITFAVVDMLYPYNGIFGGCLLNTSDATLHSGYLYLKVPATFRVIYVFGSQKDARNIKQGFEPGHKNVHFLREEPEQHQQSVCPLKAKALAKYKQVIEADGEFKKVPLVPRVPDIAVCIGTETS
jgi:hypothetical protein